MTIYLRDPRADMWGNFGQGLFQGWQANQQQKEVDRGLNKIDEFKARKQTADQLGQAVAAEQTWYNTNNQYLGIKKEWDDLNAAGQLTPEKQQELTARSHAARNAAQGLGITLPGEELDYNAMRLGLDADSRTRMAGLGSRFTNAGYAGAAQFMPQSDMGHDAGASQQPAAFNFGSSMSGLGGLLNQTNTLFADPNALRNELTTEITRMHLSPGAMEKINPVIESTLNTEKQSQLRSLYTQLAQLGNDREAARPILIELARLGVNVPENLLPSKPDWRFSTAPDGSLIRADGNTGQAAVIGNFSKPEADWLTGFAPDGTPYKVNRKTGEVVYGQKGQYAKPPRPGSVKDNAVAAAQQVAKNHNDWLRANKEAIAMKTLKESDSPWYKYLNAAQESIARSGGFNTDQQPQGSGTITDDEYNQLYNKLVFDYKMTPEQAQEYIQQHYW